MPATVTKKKTTARKPAATAAAAPTKITSKITSKLTSKSKTKAAAKTVVKPAVKDKAKTSVKSKPAGKPVSKLKTPRLIAIHRSFDRGIEGDVLTIAENGKTSILRGLDADKFLRGLKPGDEVRITSLSYFNAVLETMQESGLLIKTAHWHQAGLAKNLDGEAIALGFLNLDAAVLRPVRLRGDFQQLRTLINARTSVVGYRKAVSLQLLSIERSLGLRAGENRPQWLLDSKAEISEIEKDSEGTVEKAIVKLASTIPECVLLKHVLGVTGKTSWMTAASAVAYLGDMSRFQSPGALWHYAGQHVVDGKAPKRAKGQVQTWNGKLRTTLWAWADSMLKNMKSIWRPVYDSYLAAELEKNALRPEAERISEVHCGRRARRRVTKDVLKQFWILSNKEQLKIPKAA